jgi:hypothetical protein
LRHLSFCSLLWVAPFDNTDVWITQVLGHPLRAH